MTEEEINQIHTEYANFARTCVQTAVDAKDLSEYLNTAFYNLIAELNLNAENHLQATSLEVLRQRYLALTEQFQQQLNERPAREREFIDRFNTLAPNMPLPPIENTNATLFQSCFVTCLPFFQRRNTNTEGTPNQLDL